MPNTFSFQFPPVKKILWSLLLDRNTKSTMNRERSLILKENIMLYIASILLSHLYPSSSRFQYLLSLVSKEGLGIIILYNSPDSYIEKGTPYLQFQFQSLPFWERGTASPILVLISFHIQKRLHKYSKGDFVTLESLVVVCIQANVLWSCDQHIHICFKYSIMLYLFKFVHK